MFVNTAPKAVRELAAWGVPWSRIRKGDREVVINGKKVTITERDEAHGLLAQRDFGGTKKWRTCYVSDGTGHAIHVVGHPPTPLEGGFPVGRPFVIPGWFTLPLQQPEHVLHVCVVRTLIRRDYETAFAACDLVAMPTTPRPAFRLGEKVDDPLQMYLEDIFTVSANLSGLPAISVPCGLSSARLPLGLQLTGRAFDESTLLRAADAYERQTDWHRLMPPRPA